jgi:hypothetical protein
MNALTLMGANGVRIGTSTWGAQVYTGQIDGVFICGYALTLEQIISLYSKSSQALAPSPKSVGDHVEAMTSTNILAVFDTLANNAQVDLRVAA